MRNYLMKIAKKLIKKDDPSHDFFHALRVLKNCEIIAQKEGGDLEILFAAALFHDIVCYPKNHEKSKFSTEESANMAVDILKKISDYPQEKIETVYSAILECSFSKGLKPSSKESIILQDADKLEATGFISIMRTFASAGQMGKTFYNDFDPFCENREPEPLKYALDLFYVRLLKVKNLMNTDTAKSIAVQRTKNLEYFLSTVKKELYNEI